MNIQSPTPEELREVMHGACLTREDVASHLHVSLRAVMNWLLPVASKGHRDMPPAAWELLLLKVGRHDEYKLVRKKA